MTEQVQINTAIEKFWETVPPAWHATRATIRKVAAEKFHLTVEQFQVLRRIRRAIRRCIGISVGAGGCRTRRSCR